MTHMNDFEKGFQDAESIDFRPSGIRVCSNSSGNAITSVSVHLTKTQSDTIWNKPWLVERLGSAFDSSQRCQWLFLTETNTLSSIEATYTDLGI